MDSSPQLADTDLGPGDERNATSRLVFAEHCETLYPRLVRGCLGYVKQIGWRGGGGGSSLQEEAEELAQEALGSLLYGNRTFTATDAETLLRQLMAAAESIRRNQMKRSESRNASLDALEGDAHHPMTAFPEDEIALAVCVFELLGDDPELKAFTILRFQGENSHAVIAREMDITISRVQALHRKCQRRLKEFRP